MPQPKVWFALLLVAGAGAVWIPRFLPGADDAADVIAEIPVSPARSGGEARPLPPPTSGDSVHSSDEGSPSSSTAAESELDAESRVLLDLAQRLRGEDPRTDRLWSTAAARTTAVPEDPSDAVRAAGGEPPAWDLPGATALELEAVRQSYPVTATLVGSTARTAMLGGRLVRVGDRVTPNGPRVVAIEGQRVRIELDGEDLELEMEPFRVAARAGAGEGSFEEASGESSLSGEAEE